MADSTDTRVRRAATKRAYTLTDSEESNIEDSEDDIYEVKIKPKKAAPKKATQPKRPKLSPSNKKTSQKKSVNTARTAKKPSKQKTIKTETPSDGYDGNFAASSSATFPVESECGLKTVNKSSKKKIVKPETPYECNGNYEPSSSATFLLKGEYGAAKKEKQDSHSEESMQWDFADVLSAWQCTKFHVAKNVIRLLDEDNTVPFIARYRRGLTDGMEAEQLFAFKEAYEELKVVQAKARTVLRLVEQSGKSTPDIKLAVLSCQSLAELDLVSAPFKPGAKGTLAERARSLGLEEAALTILWGRGPPPNFHSMVQEGKEGLGSIQDVDSGVQHIIADVISKTREVLACVRQLRDREFLTLESRKARKSAASLAAKPTTSKKTTTKQATSIKRQSIGKNNSVDENKFADYFEFSVPVKHAKPHQVMALNRGEKLKFLSIKVGVPDSFWYKLQNMCNHHFLSGGYNSQLRTDICQRSFRDAWDRLLHPMVTRQVRGDLTQKAEKASLDVFSENLKHLLLIPPLKGRTVLGIDPGYKHGCKLAVVSPTGQFLQANTIYPNFQATQDVTRDPAAFVTRDLVSKFGVQVIALGNGTACREVEAWLGSLLGAHFFQTDDLSYAVVNEQGASIYSCSPEAKEEFPKLDPNLISAVSIARRLQEPMAELVKLEPKNLGVGMYQHDVPDSRLKTALDEVVQACVSFVGVDLNTASRFLLRRVSGLSDARAKSILAYRTENGPFVCRQQLMKVKGVGAKTFEQCAGFVRVMAASSGSESSLGKNRQSEYAANPLDSTNVHPEAYSAAHTLIKLSGAHLESLGAPKFIANIRAFADKADITDLATKLKLPDAQAVTQLVEALTQGLAYDPRALAQGPIFRRGLTSINDLCPGTELSGCVRNVTHFGAFVDVGVGINGLLHVSGMRGTHLALGNRVSVRVKNIDIPRGRIGLELVSVLP